MNKAFTREVDRDDEDDDGGLDTPVLPHGAKNYITAAGYARLRDELLPLIDDERPKMVETVSLGGEERRPLGERRLPVRQEAPARDRPAHPLPDQAARTRRGHRSVRAPRQRPGVLRRHGALRRAITARNGRSRILGIDEADSAHGQVSWVSPIARALLKARVGDEVRLVTPRGVETIEVLEVRYPPVASQP